jgi:hypothetical protein
VVGAWEGVRRTLKGGVAASSASTQATPCARQLSQTPRYSASGGLQNAVPLEAMAGVGGEIWSWEV